MDNPINSQEAIDTLHQLLKTQSELATEQAEANRLVRETLLQEQAKLDLESRKLALDKEVQNRKEHRLNEILQRYITANEKLISLDDAFGETVQRVVIALRQVVSAIIDDEKALFALLTRNSDDIREGRLKVGGNIEKLRAQELILSHEETLHNLQLQAASHGGLDVPPKLTRGIELERKAIEELEDKLRN